MEVFTNESLDRGSVKNQRQYWVMI